MLQYEHVTLAISTLNNICPLHTIIQNYHLMYPNMLHLEMTYVDEYIISYWQLVDVTL